MRRRRSPARWLAPIALVACAAAVYAVVNATLLDGRRRRDDPGRDDLDREVPGRRRRKSSKSRGRRRRAYTVKAGDTLSSISAKTGVSLARIQELNPKLDSQALQTGQRIKLSPVTSAPRRASGALALAVVALAIAAAALVAAPPARGRRGRRAGRPRAGGDPRRAGDGRRRLRPQRRRRAPGREHDEAHDRAADARAREALDDVSRTIRYRAAPAESVIGLRGGERMTVADLMRGLLLASANDAAATLAVRVGGTRARFVAADEQPRPRARPARHALLRTRSASTSRATTRAPRTSSSSR